MTANITELQAQCDAFNAACAVGGRVAVKLDGTDKPYITTTRTKATILSGHTAVVWTVGAGAYSLSHVSPIPDPSPQTDAWTATPPMEQGAYWHWNGDTDSAPCVLYVLWSGSAQKCFVPLNQTPSGAAEMCDEYGGYWLRLRQPRIPMEVPRA